jgi:ROK family/Winged helix-turn-helix DNA-binding
LHDAEWPGNDVIAAGAHVKSGEDTLQAMSRGSTQTGMRLYNERLVMSLIRSMEAVSKAEIARLTGLSSQTVSVIVRQLEAEELVTKGLPVKGKIGQPSHPYSLNPEGAFSIGLKVGRHSGDLILLDLAGKIRRKIHQPYRFPTAQEYLRFVKTGLADLLSALRPEQIARISGLGIAAPLELWNWEEEIGAGHAVLESWRGFDLVAEIGKLGSWPVHFSNDATAACAAERLFGIGGRFHNYAYFFLGYFVGGGIVINGNVLSGRTGYGGAFGSLPVSMPGGRQQQLIHCASLFALEKQLVAAGLDPARA